MKSKRKQILDRVMASLGGVIVLVLDAVPLGVSVWLVCNCVGNDSDPNRDRVLVLGCVTMLLFVAIAWFAVRNIVHSCKHVSMMERFVRSLSPSEPSEFLKAIGEADDVEVLVDERGRRMFVPSGSEESEDTGN